MEFTKVGHSYWDAIGTKTSVADEHLLKTIKQRVPKTYRFNNYPEVSLDIYGKTDKHIGVCRVLYGNEIQLITTSYDEANERFYDLCAKIRSQHKEDQSAIEGGKLLNSFLERSKKLKLGQFK